MASPEWPPEEVEAIQPDVWRKHQAPAGNIVELPSGQKARLRRLGVQRLAALGVLSNTDLLTSLVDKKHINRVKGSPELDEESLMGDPEGMMKALAMVDQIVIATVIEPRLSPSPADDQEPRDESKMYVEDVDLTDKMFILNYTIGRSKDLESFRREFDESVRGLGDLQAGGSSSE